MWQHVRRLSAFIALIVVIGIIALVTGIRDHDVSNIGLGSVMLFLALAFVVLVAYRFKAGEISLPLSAEVHNPRVPGRSAVTRTAMYVFGALLGVTFLAALIEMGAHPDLAWWKPFRTWCAIAFQVSLVGFGASSLYDYWTRKRRA